jgi:hypothetical protein
MREQILNYHGKHKFCPTFCVIFTGSRAVVSIKHPGNEHPTGHIDTYYGFLFWFRLLKSIKRCFNEQINK